MADTDDVGITASDAKPWYAAESSGAKDAPPDGLAVVAEALAFKETGNQLLKDGVYTDAVSEYAKGIDVLVAFEKAQKKADDALVKDSDDDDDDAKKDDEPDLAAVELREVRVSLHLNSAMALLKLERWEDAIGSADGALAVQPECVKALYRRGCARAKLLQIESAASDLKRCKKRFGGALNAGKGLYGDKEAEKEKKKRDEQLASAKKRRRHEDENKEREARGEDAISYADWEKAEKAEEKKKEDAAKKERDRVQKLRDEMRRKERAERGDDRVVVDDELDLKSCKGYKTLPNGRRTSYFTNVPDATTADLLKQEQAPKKIDSSDALERRDMKSWCDDALKKHLKTAAANVDGCALLVTAVKNCKGEASIVVSRGRARHVFEYAADLAFEASFPAEPLPGPGPVTVKGTIHLPEISSTVNDGNYDSTVSRKPTSAKLSRPRADALDAGIAKLQDMANRAIGDFVAEYQAKK
ncbi:activator of Hsp90 ATPase [Aureococcus anophagefferens]|nr:activator of Hsp90 ATPase [Aureococcus anophagefferens]